MKVIIFGGSGFLGSHVADALYGAGHTVLIFDRVKSRYLKSGQEMVVGDILDEKPVECLVKDADVVYNFAGIADINEASQKPLESVKTNIIGNTVILEACRKARIKRFVYASSLYVYSKSGSFYRSAKQACELIIENYGEVFDLPYTILRFSSLYGPRSDESNFIYRILRQAVCDNRITREGDGEEIREYIHVLDAAKGSVEILSDEFINQYVIITGNQQMKVKDLLSMISEMLNNNVKIEYVATQNNYHYEITPYNFSPKLAKRLISKTYVDLGQGILGCLQNMYHELNTGSEYGEFVVKNGNSDRI